MAPQHVPLQKRSACTCAQPGCGSWQVQEHVRYGVLASLGSYIAIRRDPGNLNHVDFSDTFSVKDPEVTPYWLLLLLLHLSERDGPFPATPAWPDIPEGERWNDMAACLVAAQEMQYAAFSNSQPESGRQEDQDPDADVSSAGRQAAAPSGPRTR